MCLESLPVFTWKLCKIKPQIISEYKNTADRKYIYIYKEIKWPTKLTFYKHKHWQIKKNQTKYNVKQTNLLYFFMNWLNPPWSL